MAVLFFTIIFIAELIIAGWLISLILKVDAAVCDIDRKVTLSREEISGIFTNLRISVNKALLKLNDIQVFVEKKKDDCSKILEPNNYLKAISFFLNKDLKKVLMLFDIAIAIKNWLKK